MEHPRLVSAGSFCWNPAMFTHVVRMMGTSLAMSELGFEAAAISSTVAVTGAVVLPLPPLLGWLSDRLGRKRFLALGYLMGTASLLASAASISLWHFWISACLGSVMSNVNNSVGSALVTDLVPRASLGRGERTSQRSQRPVLEGLNGPRRLLQHLRGFTRGQPLTEAKEQHLLLVRSEVSDHRPQPFARQGLLRSIGRIVFFRDQRHYIQGNDGFGGLPTTDRHRAQVSLT
jgi:hypothetical protein